MRKVDASLLALLLLFLLSSCELVTGFFPKKTDGGVNVSASGPYKPTFTYTGIPTSSVVLGQAVSVTSTVVPAPDSYQWYVDGVAASGAINASFSFGAALGTGVHSVTLVATKGTTMASDSFSVTFGGNPGTVTGVVWAVSPTGSTSPLIDVTVTLVKDGTTVDTTQTSATGNYSFSRAAGAGYGLTYSKAGYLTATYSGVEFVTGQDNYLEVIMHIPTTFSGTGTVSGTITDAFTGGPLGAATVDAYAGVNTTSGTPLATVTTSTTGSFNITGLSSGQYTAKVSKTSYTTATFSFYVLGGKTVPNQNFSLTPVLSSNQVRVVLTWGATPSDLDSHLTVPGATTSHIYFGSKGSSTAFPYAKLDVDDVSSYGPETTTIYTQAAGDYTYYVHDYSNKGSSTSASLASSGATVKLYMGSSVRTFYVPNGSGTLWKVFRLNGTTVTPINQMLFESTASGVASRGLGAASEDLDLVRNLPEKP